MDDIYNDMQKPGVYQKEIGRLTLEVANWKLLVDKLNKENRQLNCKIVFAYEHLVLGDPIGAKEALDE